MAGINLREESRNRLAALRAIDWERQLSDPSGDPSSLSFVSGLALGLLVGCIVAILLAPQPGRKTREQVRETGIELRTRSPRWRLERHDDSPDTLAGEAEQAEVEYLRRMSEREQA